MIIPIKKKASVNKKLPFPVNVKMGIDTQHFYADQAEYVAELNRLKSLDNRFKFYTDRKSMVGNYDLYWCTVGDTNKPAIFFDGCLHAHKEKDNAQFLIRFIEKLLDPNDNQKEFNTAFLKNYCFVCVPIANPYGYFNGQYGIHHNGNAYPHPRASEINWHGDGLDDQFKTFFGVNLNRNFSEGHRTFVDIPFSVYQYWTGSNYGIANYFMMPYVIVNEEKIVDDTNGTGIYPNHLIEVYPDIYDGCGLSAFSENETRLIRDLCDYYNVVGFADWHTMNPWQTNNTGQNNQNLLDTEDWQNLITEGIALVNGKYPELTTKMDTPQFTYAETYGGGAPTAAHWAANRGYKTVGWETGTKPAFKLYSDAYLEVFYRSIYWMQIY